MNDYWACLPSFSVPRVRRSVRYPPRRLTDSACGISTTTKPRARNSTHRSGSASPVLGFFVRNDFCGTAPKRMRTQTPSSRISQRIFFSGKRAKYLKTSARFADDQPLWPAMRLQIRPSPNPDFDPAFQLLYAQNSRHAGSLHSKKRHRALECGENPSARIYALGDGVRLESFGDSIAAADSAILIVSRLLAKRYSNRSY